ncbi:MAG: HAD family hydrolase [Candidatus Thorarchaeota archaeon]
MPPFQNFRYILLDFDGTCIDSMPFLEKNAVQLLIHYHGMSQYQATEVYRKTTGLPFVQQMEIIAPGSTDENAEIVEKFEQMKIERIYDQDPFKETPQVLMEFNRRRYKLGISSGTFEDIIKEYLERKELSRFVHDVLGWRPGFEKGRDHFEYIMNRYNLSPNELIFVGDSLNDARRSQANGIFFIGRRGMFNEEDFEQIIPNVMVINSLTDLLDILPPRN